MDRDGRWLLLLHQIPPKPDYFRAKVARRLAQIGALPLKNSAYLLPERDDTTEDFEWLCQQIKDEGGAAWLFRTEPMVGLSSTTIKQGFRDIRAPDFEELIRLAKSQILGITTDRDGTRRNYAKLHRRRQELRGIDFFDSPGRDELDRLMSEMEKQMATQIAGKNGSKAASGETWVTRRGVKVDRIGSSWLIRRFLDPEARIRFVDPNNYQRHPNELRFDMVDGEFTHRGELCTFEALVVDRGLVNDPGLIAIGEIVHDIDLKDERFQRQETVGLARMIEGLCAQTADDELRLERGACIFDSLYHSFVQDPPQ